METEYEARILEVDKQELINTLKNLNATFVGEWLQRRYVYDFNPVVLNSWIRLRTNGTKTTLTIKDITKKTIDGTKELEIEVSDFEKTNLLLKRLGYTPKGYQENKRTRFYLDDVEIDIDEWPLIPTYVELEGPNEQKIYEVVKKLGYAKENTTTNDVEGIYLDYGIKLEQIYELKLEGDRK